MGRISVFVAVTCFVPLFTFAEALLAETWKWTSFRGVKMTVPSSCHIERLDNQTTYCTQPVAESCDQTISLTVVELNVSREAAAGFAADPTGAWKVYFLASHSSMLNRSTFVRVHREKTEFRPDLASNTNSEMCFEVELKFEGATTAAGRSRMHILSLQCGRIDGQKVKTARAEISEINCSGGRATRDFKPTATQVFKTLQFDPATRSSKGTGNAPTAPPSIAASPKKSAAICPPNGEMPEQDGTWHYKCHNKAYRKTHRISCKTYPCW